MTQTRTRRSTQPAPSRKAAAQDSSSDSASDAGSDAENVSAASNADGWTRRTTRQTDKPAPSKVVASATPSMKPLKASKTPAPAAVSDSDDEEDVADKDDMCAVCNDGGSLFCCEKCPQSYHFDCISDYLADHHPSIDSLRGLPDDTACKFIGQKCCKPRAPKLLSELSDSIEWLRVAPESDSQYNDANLREYLSCSIAGQRFQRGDSVCIRTHGRQVEVAQIITMFEDPYKKKYATVELYETSKHLPNRRYLLHAEDSTATNIQDVELDTIDSIAIVFKDKQEYEKVLSQPTERRADGHGDDDLLFLLVNRADYQQLANGDDSDSNDEGQRSDDEHGIVRTGKRPRGRPRASKQASEAALALQAAKRRKVELANNVSKVSVYSNAFDQKDDSLMAAVRIDPNNKFGSASAALQLSALPTVLPCRENECQQVTVWLREAVSRGGSSGGLYISGMPGTGKTATVHQVVAKLRQEHTSGKLPAFDFVEINGMKLPDPNAAYTVIYRTIFGKSTTPAKAAIALSQHFRTPSARRRAMILLVDEIDVMLNKQQNVIYNLFDWPGRKTAKLIVVCIANTMDLPERLLPRVLSRMGLTRMIFKPYTREQIEQIVESRLAGLSLFQKDAIKFAAGKIHSVSGDVRRALQICRRAVEICEQEQLDKGLLLPAAIAAEAKPPQAHTTTQAERIRRKTGELQEKAAKAAADAEKDRTNELPVTIHHVNRAIIELGDSPYMRWVVHTSLHEKIWIASILKANKTGDEQGQDQHSFLHLAATHEQLCNAHGVQPAPTLTELMYVANTLHTIGLTRNLYKHAERWPDVMLSGKMSEEDIAHALRNDVEWAKFYTKT